MKLIIFQILFVIGFFFQSIWLFKNEKKRNDVLLGTLIFATIMTIGVAINTYFEGEWEIYNSLDFFTGVFCLSFLIGISFYFVATLKEKINFYIIFQILLIAIIFAFSPGGNLLFADQETLINLNYSPGDIKLLQFIDIIFYIPVIILILSLIFKKIKNNLTIFAYILLTLYFQLVNYISIIPKDGTNLIESYKTKELSFTHIFDTILYGGIFFQLMLALMVTAFFIVGLTVFDKNKRKNKSIKKDIISSKENKSKLIKITIVTLIATIPSFFFAGIDLARFLALVVILHPIFITFYLRFSK